MPNHPSTFASADAALGELQSRLGYTFTDAALLQLALTHPSTAHEQASAMQTNQRLEFLGDAVLQLILTGELYEKYPASGEGALTKARATLVNRRALAERGRQLELGRYLRVSRGEETSGGRERASALADAYEALVGAVFLDGGYEVARGLVLREFQNACGDLGETPNLENPKGELQELLQSISPAAPQYQVISATGPDHDPIFECTVLHAGVELARGSGKSKKQAQSNAAVEALRLLRSRPAGQSSGNE